MLRKKEKKL